MLGERRAENGPGGLVAGEVQSVYRELDPPPPTPVEMASSLPAAIALGITVADIYAAIFQRLGPQAAPALALELTRAALASQLVGTLMTRKE